LLVQLVRMARTESQAPRESVATVAPRACAALLVPPDLRDSRERRARRAVPVLVGSRVFKAPRETQATVARRGLAAVVRPAPKAPRVSRGQRESVVLPVLVLAAQLAPWVPRVNVVRWASRARREILAHQAHRESQAGTVSRETRVLPVPWAGQVFVAPRVIAVCRAPRVTLVSRAPRVTREMSASVDLVDQPVLPDPPVSRVQLGSVDPSVPSAAVA